MSFFTLSDYFSSDSVELNESIENNTQNLISIGDRVTALEDVTPAARANKIVFDAKEKVVTAEADLTRYPEFGQQTLFPPASNVQLPIRQQKNFNGKDLYVYSFISPASTTSAGIQSTIATEDAQNLYDFGGCFGKSVLIRTSQKGVIESKIYVSSRDVPAIPAGEVVTYSIGVSAAGSSDTVGISYANTATTVTTRFISGIDTSKPVHIEVNIPPNLGVATLYINGSSFTDNLYPTSANYDIPSTYIATLNRGLTSAGASEEIFVDLEGFGAVFLKEPQKKIITQDDYNGVDSLNVYLPRCRGKNFTLTHSSSITNVVPGTSLNIFCPNRYGSVTIDNEDTSNPAILIDNKASFTREINGIAKTIYGSFSTDNNLLLQDFSDERVGKAIQDIAQNTTDIAKNTAAITQNTIDIAKNTAAITQNTIDIIDLKASQATQDTLIAGKADITYVDSEVTDLKDFLMGGSVDVSLDTLKEIADWIAADETASATLVTKVTDLETSQAAQDTDIAEINEKVGFSSWKFVENAGNKALTLKTDTDVAIMDFYYPAAKTVFLKDAVVDPNQNASFRFVFKQNALFPILNMDRDPYKNYGLFWQTGAAGGLSVAFGSPTSPVAKIHSNGFEYKGNTVYHSGNLDLPAINSKIEALEQKTGYVVRKVSFDTTEAYISGERPITEFPDWASVSAGEVAIRQEVQIAGKNEWVYTINDIDSGTIWGLERNLDTTNVQSIFDNGASFFLNAALDETYAGGVFVGFQVDLVDAPTGSSYTADMRYGFNVRRAADGTLSIIDVDPAGFGTVNIPETQATDLWTIAVNIPAGFGDASIYINGLELPVKIAFAANTGGRGTKMVASSGSTSAANRVTHVKEFGAVILNEPPTKVFNQAAIVGADAFEFLLPSAIGKTFGLRVASDVEVITNNLQIGITCANEFGRIIIDNEDNTDPKVLINGRAIFEQDVVRTQKLQGVVGAGNNLEFQELIRNPKVQKKTEVTFGVADESGTVITPISVLIPQSTTGTDGVNILSVLPTPTTGSLYPFINSTLDRVQVFNETQRVDFKMNVIGTFTGGFNGGLGITYAGAIGDVNTSELPNLGGQVTHSFETFFSVDKDGAISQTGFEPRLYAIDGDFTIQYCSIMILQDVDELTPMVPASGTIARARFGIDIYKDYVAPELRETLEIPNRTGFTARDMREIVDTHASDVEAVITDDEKIALKCKPLCDFGWKHVATFEPQDVSENSYLEIDTGLVLEEALAGTFRITAAPSCPHLVHKDFYKSFVSFYVDDKKEIFISGKALDAELMVVYTKASENNTLAITLGLGSEKIAGMQIDASYATKDTNADLKVVEFASVDDVVAANNKATIIDLKQ